MLSGEIALKNNHYYYYFHTVGQHTINICCGLLVFILLDSGTLINISCGLPVIILLDNTRSTSLVDCQFSYCWTVHGEHLWWTASFHTVGHHTINISCGLLVFILLDSA